MGLLLLALELFGFLFGDIKTREDLFPRLFAFMAGFVVSIVLIPPTFFFPTDLGPYYFCFFLPIVGGVIAGIRQRKYGRGSIMPIVRAIIAGSIGAILALFFFYCFLWGA